MPSQVESSGTESPLNQTIEKRKKEKKPPRVAEARKGVLRRLVYLQLDLHVVGRSGSSRTGDGDGVDSRLRAAGRGDTAAGRSATGLQQDCACDDT